MRKWEYHYFTSHGDELELILNDYGKEGWEVVGYDCSENRSHSIIIKREILQKKRGKESG